MKLNTKRIKSKRFSRAWYCTAAKTVLS